MFAGELSSLIPLNVFYKYCHNHDWTSSCSQIFLFPRMGVAGDDWRALLQYQAATYAICIGGAVALVPLNLHVRDAPEESVRGRMLSISGLEMFKSPILYALAAIFLFSSLGWFLYSIGA